VAHITFILEHDKAREATAKEKESQADLMKVYHERVEEHNKEVEAVKVRNEKLKKRHEKEMDAWKIK
jgi:hypothetical protein